MAKCFRFGLSLLLASGFLVCRGVAQDAVPNGGFELWASGNPTGWTTDNAPGGIYTPITQSATAHSGSSALQGAVITYMTIVVPPLAEIGFSVSHRDASLTGYYQYSPQSGDELTIGVAMALGGTAIGGGSFITTSSVSSYTPFSIPISYYPGHTSNPDSAYIVLVISNPSGGSAHVGSTLLLDDLTFSGINGVAEQSREPLEFALDQNYPNPFNPSTLIKYSVATDVHVTLAVFNILGERVATLVDGNMPAGSHSVNFDASRLPSGMYVYRLSAGDFVQTKTMTLLK